MNLVSKVRKELKTAPGVTVTLRPLTEKRRIALILATSDDESQLEGIRAEVKAAMAEVEPLIVAAKNAKESGAANAGELTADLAKNSVAKQLVSLYNRATEIQARIDEAAVRAVVISVEGLRVDDLEVGLDGLFEFVPFTPLEEVIELAKAGVGMTADDVGNSGSPITSPA